VKVAIELTASQGALLRQQAARLGVPAEELARAAVVDLLTTRAEDFRGAADHIVRKNAELYRRLA
jgi:hypothetical protein